MKEIAKQLKQFLIPKNIKPRGTEDNMFYVDIDKTYLQQMFPNMIEDEENVLFVFGVPHPDWEGYAYGLEVEDPETTETVYLCVKEFVEDKEMNSFVQKLFDEFLNN